MKLKTLKEIERAEAIHRSFVDRLNTANKKTPSEALSHIPFSKARGPLRGVYHLNRGLILWSKGYLGKWPICFLLLTVAVWYISDLYVAIGWGIVAILSLSFLYSTARQERDDSLIIGARLLDKRLGENRYQAWLERAEYVKEDQAFRYIYKDQWISAEQLQSWSHNSNTEVLFSDYMDVMVNEKIKDTVQVPRQEKNHQGHIVREWVENREVTKNQMVPTRKFVIVLRNIGTWKTPEELRERELQAEKQRQEESKMRGFRKFFQHQFQDKFPGLHHEYEDEYETVYCFFHDGGLTIDDWKKGQGRERLGSYIGREVVDIRRSKKYNRHVEVVVAKYEPPEKLAFDSAFVPEEDRLFFIGMSHKPIIVDFDVVPHLIVAASSGGGKSVCLNNLVVQAIMRNSIVYFADYKGTETALVKQKGYRVVNRAPEFESLLEDILKESERRGEMFQRVLARDIRDFRAKTSSNLPRIYLFIDEASQFLVEDTTNSVEEKLLRAAQEVRYAGIHIILCTQRPSANVLSTDIRAQLTGRIAGYMDNETSSKMVLGSNAAHSWLSGKLKTGRMIVGGAYGPDLEVQTPFVDLDVMDDYIPKCSSTY